MKNSFKIAIIFLVLLIGFYVVFQVYNIANPSYKVEVASLYQVTDSIPCEGIIFRDEVVVSITSEGVIEYTAQNGDKVAQGSIVAKMHYSPSAAKNDLARSLISDRQSMYRDFASAGGVVSTNYSSLNTTLYKNLLDLSGSIDRFTGVDSAYRKVASSMYNFMTVSGNEYTFGGLISRLEDRKANYPNDDAQNASFVHAPVSGYFCNKTDGYEDTATRENALQISIDELNEILDNRNEQININRCKLITNYSWYYVARISSSDAERFYKGMKVNLTFDDSAVGQIPVTVQRVETDPDKGTAMVVLSCLNLNADITDLRFETGKINFNDYKGIRVDRSALHEYEGEFGVFIKYGTTIVFRELDIIYETDSYVVSSVNTSDSSKLRLYDEIIVEGKDLYVGKDLSR
ncbi:MAG: hypothetical protein IKE18_06825 [Oscillospiraceae bacterium]|nr:hypothetical protein [Oscillospiraceae bacterium]